MNVMSSKLNTGCGEEKNRKSAVAATGETGRRSSDTSLVDPSLDDSETRS